MDSKNTNKKIYVSPVLEAVEADKAISLGMKSLADPGNTYTLTVYGESLDLTDYVQGNNIYISYRRKGASLYNDVLAILEDAGLDDEQIDDYFENNAEYTAAQKWATQYAAYNNLTLKGASADASAFGASDAWGDASSPFGN